MTAAPAAEEPGPCTADEPAFQRGVTLRSRPFLSSVSR